MIKIETISQLEGFGNEIPKRGEYHRAVKMYRGDNGLVVGRTLIKLASDVASLASVNKFAKGDSIGNPDATYSANTKASFLLMAGSGDNSIYQSYLGIFQSERAYRVMGQNWFGLGFIVDPTGRLLYPGGQYLGMMDPTVSNYTTGTISVTNGSAAVVGTGTTFVSGDVGKTLRVQGSNGSTDYYRILSFTDATHITLASNYAGTTNASASYVIYRAWSDTWKDFGSSLYGTISDIPCEVYEDTVLFGRGNNILTLNVTTDTITTDSVPAFNTPSGFVSKAIVANTTGILLGWNFQGKGVLMLWDNYSDRSIAPWIRLDDVLLGLYRANGGWVIVTSKAVYFSNGYGLQLLADRILGSSDTLLSSPNAYNGIVLGNQLYIGLGWDGRRRRAGLYKLDLKTLEFEYYGNYKQNQYDGNVQALYYSADFGRLYAAFSTHVAYLYSSPDQSETYSCVTEEIGQGQNMKVAEGIKLPLSLARNWQNVSQSLTFDIEAKINTLDRPLYMRKQVKTTATALNQITVDESSSFLYTPAQVGDELEFVKSGPSQENNSCIRSITAITGGGTATAVYTLDSDLPALAQASDVLIHSGFKSIKKYSFSAVSALPELYFDIKNRYKAKSFMVKFVVTNCNAPIEIQPFQFIYDDLGPLQ